MEMEFIKSERNSKTGAKNEIFEDIDSDETEEDFQVKVEPKYEVTFFEDNCAQRFKCTICNTLLYSNDHLIPHVYKNHNFLDNILFNCMKCSLCGEDFSQFRVETAKILLVQHVKNHH